jgi:hypothetical protein
MSFILRRPKKSRWTMFHQIMFGISVFDCVSATAFILGTIPAPEDTGLYHASGNDATCNFQGKTMHYSWLLVMIAVFKVFLTLVHALHHARLDVPGRANIHVLQRCTFDLLLVVHKAQLEGSPFSEDWQLLSRWTACCRPSYGLCVDSLPRTRLSLVLHSKAPNQRFVRSRSRILHPSRRGLPLCHYCSYGPACLPCASSRKEDTTNFHSNQLQLLGETDILAISVVLGSILSGVDSSYLHLHPQGHATEHLVESGRGSDWTISGYVFAS